MYNDSIKTLEYLIKENQELTKEIGKAIQLLKFCQRNKITPKQTRVTRLPDTKDAFGYFIVQECNEVGGIVQTLCKTSDMPLEFLPESLIIESTYPWKDSD